MAKKTAVLVVLDGWGIGAKNESNPIYVIKPETFAWLEQKYPVTSLLASGIAVGLPWGEVGNSEVGHLTIGAGKVLYQYYPKITMTIDDGSFFQNKALKAACAHARERGSAVNFLGLLTKANIHASLTHLQALIKMASAENVSKINLHLFADGKDSPPHSVSRFLAELPREYLASLIGRYYAMERDGNWQLTATAYQTVTGQLGRLVADLEPFIQQAYKDSGTEEYLPPMRFADDKKVMDGDAVVFFNYREDSIRQLAASFILKNFDKFPILPFKDLFVATMTHYEDAFDVPVAFPADKVDTPIGKVFADRGMAQLRVAETYKYAHVTYFFNGLREPPYPGEYRTLVPSASELHPEKHPEMMASAITDRVSEAIASRAFNFILANYANPDSIAHTSDYQASLEAVRVMDREIARVVKAAADAHAILIVTSDHGHIDELINPVTGLQQSQHTPNPVPLYLVADGYEGRRFVNYESLEVETLGSLADIAPTILELMDIPAPAEMTGHSMLDKLL